MTIQGKGANVQGRLMGILHRFCTLVHVPLCVDLPKSVVAIIARLCTTVVVFT